MRMPLRLMPPWPMEKLARIREIERDFHVRAFGEELARVNLDLTPEERRRYLAWMRKTARAHGVKIGRAKPPEEDESLKSNLPAPVGNLPTGMAAGVATKPAPGSLIDAAPVSSGRLPDVTGRWPVLPKTIFQPAQRLRFERALKLALRRSNQNFNVSFAKTERSTSTFGSMST